MKKTELVDFELLSEVSIKLMKDLEKEGWATEEAKLILRTCLDSLTYATFVSVVAEEKKARQRGLK